MKQNNDTITVPVDDFGGLLNSVIRYSLGRRTYVVSDTCNIIRKNISVLDDRTIGCAERDIREASDYGANIDQQEWIEVLQILRDEQKKRGLTPWN